MYIANGSFSTIYKYKNVAIKHIKYSKTTIKSILELYILKNLKNKYIVNCYDIIFDNYYNINIIEPIAMCDMNIFLKKHKNINILLKKQFMYEISLAVKFLHDLNIIHCDIKPSNILVFKIGKKYNIKLTDFGLSKLLINNQDIQITELLYTKQYRPIEVFNLEYVNLKSDIWALGCTFYEIEYGVKLFTENNTIDNILYFEKNINNFKLNDNILSMLKVDNNSRISINSNRNYFYNNCKKTYNYNILLNTQITDIIDIGENTINPEILEITSDLDCLYLSFSIFNNAKHMIKNNVFTHIPLFKTCLIIAYKIIFTHYPFKISIYDVGAEIELVKLLNYDIFKSV